MKKTVSAYKDENDKKYLISCIKFRFKLKNKMKVSK